MKGNFDFNTFKEEFLDMLEEFQYNIRQTRNGIELSTEGVRKALLDGTDDLTQKFKQRLDRIHEDYKEKKDILIDISREGGKDKYVDKRWEKKLKEEYRAARTAGMDVGDSKNYAKEKADELRKEIEEQIDNAINTFYEYPKTIESLNKDFKDNIVKTRKQIDKELLDRQLNVTSFGFTGRVNRKKDNIATYGHALDGLAGRFTYKSAAMTRLASIKGIKGDGMASKAIGGLAKGLGGLGTAVKFASGLFTKLAGPIGWLISALQLFGDAVNAINKYELEQLQFDKEKYQADVDFTKQNLELENQTKVEQINYEYEILQRNFDVESEIAKAAKSLSANNYAKAVEISLGSITQGISQTAFSAASAAIEAGATSMTNLNTANVEREKAAASNAARGVKNQATLENINQDLISSQIAYENATSEIAQKRLHNKQQHNIVSNLQDTSDGVFLGATEVMAAGSGPEDDKGVVMSKQRYDQQEAKSVGSAVGDAVVNGIKSTTGGLESTQELLEANLAYSNLQRASEQDITKLRIKNLNEQNTLLVDYETNLYNKKMDLDKAVYDTEMEQAKKVAQEYLKLTQKEFDVFGKLDETLRGAAISVGMLNENSIEKYTEMMTKRMPDVMREWGVTFDEIIKIQNSYHEATGRSINLSDKDVKRSLGLTMLTGDQSTTNELNADMQIFAMSVADSSQMFGEILDDSRQIGLDMRKMGKNLVRDMKLANRYEFKGGVKALAKMSEWATKVRFDMTNLPAMIDKYTNSLEDSITNAASIQVLGGNFASNMGDPLRNSYLGFMDPVELAKNQNEALKGIGYFDKNEGKTKIGIADQINLKAFANATGQSMESLRAQITQQVQGDEVMRNLTSENSKGYTEKQKELLQQQAFRDENGVWKVTLQNGETKDINEISQSDFSDLMPHEEAMYDLTKKGVECLEALVAKNKKMEGETNAEQLELFQNHTKEFYEAYDEMVVTARDYFKEHKDEFQNVIDENLALVKNSYKGLLDVANAGNEGIDTKAAEIQKSANEIATTLGEVSRVFAEAKDKLVTGFGNNVPSQSEARANVNINNVSDNLNKVPIGTNTASDFIKKVDALSVKVTGTHMDFTGGVKKNPKSNDGLISQNGVLTPIDDNDQLLAAKTGGPLDKMVNSVKSAYNNVTPRSMPYDSYVKENPNQGNNMSNGGGKIEIAPIQININGNIQISGTNGTIDITQQIANDPNFIRSLSQMISLEVEKKVQGGRVYNPLNRGLKS